MTILNVGGVALPNPASYSVQLSDLDSENTTRTSTGRLKRSRVRAGVYKIDVGWQNITKTQLKTITDAISPAKITVTFFNPTKSSNTTTSMYVGDRTGTLSAAINEKKPNDSRWNLSFNLVEY